jgi:hypothetical protein
MLMKRTIATIALAAISTVATLALADDAKSPKPYPLKTCLVSGEKLGEGGMTPVAITNDNQIIKFCCANCVKDFKKDPAKYMKKLDEAVKTAKDAKKE